MWSPINMKHEREPEASRLEDLLEYLMTDDSLSDVSLRCTDGQVVTANRCILAGRSIIFRQLLGSGTGGGSLRVDYNGEVMKAVVEFVYTDSTNILRTALQKANNQDPFLAKTLVYVADAALHFGLPGLFEKVQDAGRHLLQEHGHLACPLLEACRMVGYSSSPKAWTI
jgi:hypothetical protein